MKRTIQVAVLLLALAGFAAADPVTLDFTNLLAPVNITDTATSVDVVSGGVTVDVVSMSYLPEDVALPRCGFDAATGGIQWNGACVGAHVDTPGLFGTTEGLYQLMFAVPLSQLSFTYGMFSLLDPPPADVDFSANALFFLDGNFTDTLTVTGPTNLFDYTGPTFNEAQLLFTPTAPQFDPTSGLNIPGQTIVQISSAVATPIPEPDMVLLLATGLCTIFGCGWFKRARSK